MLNWFKSGKTSIPIVVPDKNHKLATHFETFEKMLLKDDIKDSNIAVISIAGTPREGKSLFMSLCAHYLEMVCNSKGELNTSTWLKNDDTLLSSVFVWRAGTDKVTTGVQMWPEIFSTTVNGEKVAIVLLDTQGTFDKDITIGESVVVFALSLISSSVQIYNVHKQVNGEHLQHLQLFTEYAKLDHSCKNSEKPFQKLQFLVRDWAAPFQHDYGDKGGQDYLDDKVLRTSKSQSEEINSVRESIKSCFGEVRCFLAPEPSKHVKYNPEFDGRISDMGDEFITYLQEFIPSLLAPQNLILKEMDGQKIKVSEFVSKFKNCANSLIANVHQREPKTILMSMAEQSHSEASSEGLKHFNVLITQYHDEKRDEYIDIEEVKSMQDKFKLKALEVFEKSRFRIGGDAVCKKYKEKMEKNIDSKSAKSVTLVQERNEKIMNEMYRKASLEVKERYENLMKEKLKTQFANSKYTPMYAFQRHHECSKDAAFQVFKSAIRENFGGKTRYEQELKNLERSIKVFYDGHLEEVKKNNKVVVTNTCKDALSSALDKYRESLPRSDMIREEKEDRSLRIFEYKTCLIKSWEYERVETARGELLKEMQNAHASCLAQTKTIAKNALFKFKAMGFGGTIVGGTVAAAAITAAPVTAVVSGFAAAFSAIVFARSKLFEGRIDACEEIDEIRRIDTRSSE